MSTAAATVDSTKPVIDPESRQRHLRWLAEITSLPTAAGREWRVIQWIRRFVAERPELTLTEDPSGNLVVAFRDEPAPQGDADRPLFLTAHLDHPAFVIERLVSPTIAELSFRGGVMADYFKNARVALYDARDAHVAATLTGETPAPSSPFTHYLAELDAPLHSLAVGDVAVWKLPPAEVIDNQMHTLACDDLAALAAAVAAFDELRRLWKPGMQRVRLLFTRAEEIGFVGAIAAVRHQTMPRNARVIALENSRSFTESPIHGGPIVRVGDRISVFSPTLTDAVARRAEEIAGAPSTVTAAQKNAALPSWKWQRKLMAGGACEASVFFHHGYEATCVCLPLGNYHNMADLANVQAGTNTTPPTIAREFIGVDDYHNLVDLLLGCSLALPPAGNLHQRLDQLWTKYQFVLT